MRKETGIGAGGNGNDGSDEKDGMDRYQGDVFLSGISSVFPVRVCRSGLCVTWQEVVNVAI